MRFRFFFTLLLAGALFGAVSELLSAQAEGDNFPGAENWDASIDTIGLTRTVHSLAFDSQYLYIGEGYGIESRHIRRWNGSHWESIADNVDGPVLALLADGAGKLYAGGYFTQTGGCNPCKRVALWDGTNWSALGDAITGEVISLARDNSGTIFAGGDFGVQRWDGSTWTNESLTDTVYALAFDPIHARLHAAGRGYLIDDDSGDQIAIPSLKSKSTEGWQDMGGSINNDLNSNLSIFSLAVYPAGTITPTVGGTFQYPTDKLAIWISGTWETVGTPDDIVFALAADSCGGL